MKSLAETTKPAMWEQRNKCRLTDMTAKGEHGKAGNNGRRRGERGVKWW
jgi:hypothetical protein